MEPRCPAGCVAQPPPSADSGRTGRLGDFLPPPRYPPTTFRPWAVTVPPWEAADTTLLFLRRELVPGRPALVWYEPDGTRVVSEGHTLVSLTGLRPVSGLKVGGRGQAEGAVP